MPDTVSPTLQTTAQDLVIVIDHAGARVFPVCREVGPAPQELHHLKHHIDRTQHDADRAEAYPADTHFFDAVAAAVAGSGRLVVISHGKGQGNEAGHLMAYLGKHHAGVQARVEANLTADLAHSTVPQLLALAHHALWPARTSADSVTG